MQRWTYPYFTDEETEADSEKLDILLASDQVRIRTQIVRENAFYTIPTYFPTKALKEKSRRQQA